MNPVVAEGDVLTLHPEDYCVGRDVLRIRVTHVPRYANCLASAWVRLCGVELRPDGLPLRERIILARVRALVEQRARADGRRPC
ncbi:hypothetical protein E1091_03790 [Micromonospora fluostatini]|uniref:Uncharacterized protein n=1 Tax=Micromonospora fluostatini TaxID=1629071 RepID=A0ABY2DMR0_9ACTN|nr:hypothetical protein E1091_03790 [Micromonospora fluostatini]